jgi:hypothetical protein
MYALLHLHFKGHKTLNLKKLNKTILFLLVKQFKMNCQLMLTYDTPAYMFNVYKNQPSRQTGSRNLTGQKTLPTKWGTYMKLVMKYQISAINIC